MSSTPIRVLRSNVSRSEAVGAFEAAGINRLPGVRYLRPLRSVAELYVPFRLYRVSIRRAAAFDQRWMALDLVFGGLDPFNFEALPSDAETELITTRNRPSAVLDDLAAQNILTTKIQRVLFQSGFFRMKNLQIQIDPASFDLHMPYWIGFFGSGDLASIRVLDATRRVMEGGKFRRFIYQWLSA